MSEDCYFFIDLEEPEDERKISVLCLTCREEKLPDTGWFWQGSKRGYGPFNYKCCHCDKIIHSKKGKNENIKTAS